MKNSIVIVIAIWMFAIFGYFANIYRLTKCDFDTPLKAETIRFIGVFFPPAGVVMGYIDIED
jgi:hypothetical protein